jgi:capsular polysaccharide biosynthesis protein
VELRAYWSIIWRRIWVVALVVIIVALYSGYQYYKIRKTPGALHAYQSNVTLLIGLQASSKITDHSNYSDYVSVSESIADEFTTGPTITSPKFDQQVYDQVNTDMPQIKQKFGAHPDLGDLAKPGIAVGAIGSSVTASRAHSLVTVSVSWNTPAGAWAIANAIGEVSVAHINDYSDYVVTNDATRPSITTPERPVVAAKVIIGATDATTIPGSQASKPTLLLVLVLVALLIGIALAFLIEYLDDRIRKADDVVQLLQLPVFGEVPHAPSPGNVKPRGTHTAA